MYLSCQIVTVASVLVPHPVKKSHKHRPATTINILKLKNSNVGIITHIGLILSGDIQLNLGPCSTIYPFGICEHTVT